MSSHLTLPSGSAERHGRRPRNRRLTISAAVASAALIAGVAPAQAAPDEPDVALEWYDITVGTLASDGAATQVTNSRTWAIGWTAAARALRDAPGGAEQEEYQGAALASSVHWTLAELIPARRADLDAALDRTLSRIPDGPAEERGVARGRDEARALLADRADDGLDPDSVNKQFPAPEPAPGVWQPTPPEFGPALQAGTRDARPFLLDRADQYRPGPPPALGSERYRADLEEVRAVGAANSTVRTPEQTDTAEFWYASSLTLYNGALRAAVEQSRETLGERVDLVAIFHAVLVDTQIATSDAKYAYLAWRPVTAIRSAESDGDPATVPDPGWEPLHVTPSHPDYPSGHNTYAGAAEGVLTALFGAATPEPFAITSPALPGSPRTYTAWRTLTQENTDARVWSGIHTRTADLVGADLGRSVARHGISVAKRLFER